MRMNHCPTCHCDDGVDMSKRNSEGALVHWNIEGSRFHVISYALVKGKAVTRCSESDCEINK